jgi:hypothetical protein
MIKLNRRDVEFILENLELSGGIYFELSGFLKSVHRDVCISPESADLLRDLCGDRLQEIGFDKDYVLTENGRRLEELVDKLFIG